MARIHDHENEITYFAKTNFRQGGQKFGIKTDDRRRHMYIVGKTGAGKTTLLENMVLQDIYNGHGICYVDPHGDTVERILDFIPSWRLNDVVYFNPADLDFPVGFNVLDEVSGSHKHLVASGLMSVFKKIWENMWSARMEYILGNTILALLDTPGSTLLGINRMYSDPDYRRSIIENIKDPVVKQFWVMEYAAYSEKFATEAVAAVQNKVGQFLSSDVIRNIVAQVKSTIDVREIMDSQKILLVNLSKGRIGEDNSRLLGGMLINKVQLAAMERVDMPEKDRKDFYLYVDEFQNFATESFAGILSEARKYRLNLIVAHQYIAQLTEEVRDAVLGNVGTMTVFRVGAPDAQELETEFMPRFTPEDIINLPKYQVYLKLMIDGMASPPFSATTLPPIAQNTGSEAKVIRMSRERYSADRSEVEAGVIKWTGLEDADIDQLMDQAKAKGSGNQAKVKHKYKCSWTGKEFSIPVKLDRGRPIYSEEGKEMVRAAKKDGTYDPRKDIIYSDTLEPIGSVAELGTDGLWAVRNEEGDIIGRKDEDSTKRDRRAAKETEKQELEVKLAKAREEMKESGAPAASVEVAPTPKPANVESPKVERPAPRLQEEVKSVVGASLNVLKQEGERREGEKRKRRRKKPTQDGGGDRGGSRSRSNPSRSTDTPRDQQPVIRQPAADVQPKTEPDTKARPIKPGEMITFGEE
ncbi:hypothetical protein COV06_00150 [Candidatus Uhrbacteria bacterium CG10_big_fil_rev_8_21_14_0_10_50_16]|uniref:Type IV secretion system coupling protein TraD DNA-binding domain-containing protein n=1 Tax=Candidatus Uhrbacteria bacterium CG10_big_fil_rev_8_21_14_0_10_50_16 TaxID=1975039 RepID=A0A2H0RMS4_9BACT|nr:MAG: hypothetical protein COV06_00150 [Candidatus Uhrbacteria bacterium CG10_big_fil_rev_8_21_14_0_10_50_16]